MSFKRVPIIGKFTETADRLAVAGGGVMGAKGTGIRVSFWGEETDLELDGGELHNIVNELHIHSKIVKMVNLCIFHHIQNN